MVLPPKTLAWRLLAWSGLLVWAIWKLRDTDVDEVFVPTPSVIELARTPDAAPPVGEPAAVVDPEAALRAMDAAVAGAEACGATGSLEVELGADGLQAARLVGVGDAACVAGAVWTQAWPRAAGGFAMERALR